MVRKQQKIFTKSYMPLTSDDEVKVCLRDLNNNQKDYLGALLKTQFLNTLYAGNYQFQAKDMLPIDEMFPDIPSKTG